MKPITAILLSAGILSPAFVFAAVPPAIQSKSHQSAAPAGPVKVTSVEGITEYRLANGLRVLLFPDDSKPTLTTNIVYMVGSRHENYGETGMAHLLEHLMFKPSANFGVKKGSKTPVEVLNSTGARFNGTTWYDRTNYYATFPASDDNLRQMLALEADRMVNAAIDQNDLWNPATQKGEMTVVRNEFEMGESDPIGVTSERIQAVAYDWHNYGKSTIGARSDIEQVNIPRLRAFYHKYYQPDNALLMVAGRFDEAKVLKQISDVFGKIPKPQRIIEPTYTAEPTQDGERSVTVRRSGGTQFVGAGYHVAPSGNPDEVALEVLGKILTDAPGGRLHKALVETRLASRIDINSVSNLEPGYTIFGAVVPADGKLDEAQGVMLNVLENIKQQPITEAEVVRARQQVSKAIELATSDTARLTIALTESLAAGDWRLFFLQRDQLEKIDAAAVQAAAVKYLKSSNRTVGRFIPTDAPDRTVVPAYADVAPQLAGYTGRAVLAKGEAFDPSPDNIEARTQRFTLPGGLKGALLPKKTKGGAVSVVLQLRMGSAASLQGKQVTGEFAAALLLHGGAGLSRQEIKDRFDQLNMQVAVNGNAEGVSATLTGKRENLAKALDLLGQVLRKPAYAESEFLEAQRERVGRAEQDMPEPQPLALNAFQRLIDANPQGHVRYVGTLPEQLAQLKSASLDDIKAFHAQYYGASDATFSAVGDFDPAALKAQVAALFGDWKAAQPYVRIPDTIKPAAGAKLALETPDKANSFLLALEPMQLKDDAVAYPALLIANHMLGGGTLRSRLADRIRQKEGLSYGVGSQLTVRAREPASLWFAYAISAPQNTAKVEAALREEIDTVLKDGFAETELAEAKKAWLQSKEVARTSDAPLAGKLSLYLELGRTMAYDKDLEQKVNALTLVQVNDSLRHYLKPADLSVISAGDFSKAGQPAK
ncbi:M16 family metallopeptidase [Janthinobacterium agaricidamnosum]|uniref:Putative zinc protease n=1 Tax=Janthinobacterium agaricidamnosum NBRC 102515 = DSM 9628 TaxID=1349767 RepID=W0VAI8_9BURK|nr:pitrilysin family protein [Janthinobacterium agaricidamnosum]CDG84373.1 putative zinc protease [Janthinobacterium agaricidamnosum NBRC 102515 = DSM 9628]